MKNINNKNRIKDFWNFLTVPSGRRRRRDSLVVSFCLTVSVLIFFSLIELIGNVGFMIVSGIFFWIIFVWIGIVNIIKRIQDIGISQFWGILMLIPYIGFIPGLFFILKDGTIGPNKYGEDPKGRTANNRKN